MAVAQTTTIPGHGEPGPVDRPRWRPDDVVAVVAVAVVSFVVAVGHVWWTQGFTPDDAYISMRYAANLAEGHGWTYNVGSDSANGATSPLYVLVLAGLQVLRDAPEANANIVTVLTLTVAATAVFVLLRHLRSSTAGILGAALVLLNLWFPLTRSMETSLLLALVSVLLALTFVAPPSARWAQVTTGVTAGLVVLTRGEALVLVALVAAWVLWRDRRVPWWTVLAGGAVLTTWAVTSWALIGSPLPATLDAKVAQGQSGFWGHRTAFLTDWTAPVQDLGWLPWFVVVIAGATLSLWTAWRSEAVRPLVVLLGAWAALHVVVLGLVLRVPGYFWYFAPPLYCLLLLAALGLDTLLGLVPSWNARLAVALVAVVALGLFVRDRSLRGFQHGHYGDVAAWIRTNTEPEATVAAAEIGVVGFQSERPIIDFLGLLDTEAADDLREGDLQSWLYRTPPDTFIAHQPVWVFEVQALGAPGFAEAYRLEAGDRGMWVFQRHRPLDADTTDPIIIAPDRFLDTLHDEGVAAGAADDEALQQLAAVYIARRDLQVSFGRGESIDVVQLFAWARDVGRRQVEDISQDDLAPFADRYAEMGAAAEAAHLGHVRFTDPLAPPP